MRLLIFDDDPAIGRLITRTAVMSGFEAVAVTDAAAFRQSLTAQLPDAVMLDLQVANGDGIEQVRVLAELNFRGVLVLISGLDGRVLQLASSLAQNLGLGVAGVLTKPIRVGELDALLERVKHARWTPTVESVLAAIREDELVLEFQPIVTRRPRALRRLEALVRWEHPTMGRLPPGDFLSVAEGDRTTIDALTEWVIGAAIESWQVLSSVGMQVPIAINVSSQNLHDLELPDRLATRLREGSMPCEMLCLELTETAAFHDAARSMDILGRLRLKGMQLALDDFGTGYSSLKLLRQMPFSAIKIDHSFVADMERSRDSLAIVKATIDLAANMEMDSIAEGVETEGVARLLEQMKVGALQGFLIAPALPVEAVPAWQAFWLAGEAGRPRMAPSATTADAAAAREIAPAVDDATPANVAAPTGGAKPTLVSGSVTDPTVVPEPLAAVQLTPRQLDVMRLLSEGCSTKDIARRLDLSVGTVKVHLSMAYSALGARNRVEAVMRAGLVVPAA